MKHHNHDAIMTKNSDDHPMNTSINDDKIDSLKEKTYNVYG